MRGKTISLRIYILVSIIFFLFYICFLANFRSKNKIEQENNYENYRTIPSAPKNFWLKYRLDKKKNLPKCAPYPSLLDLHYSNTFWQTFESSNGSYQLYAAYYDDREKEDRFVRILANINRVKPKTNLFCQIWFEDSEKPIHQRVKEREMIWPEYWGHVLDEHPLPFLISCPLPKDEKRIPQTVSLVENLCASAKNNLRVIYEPLEDKETRKQFMICVKGLDFPENDDRLIARLVEWIELNFILGADKISFHILQANPKLLKVLHYYAQKDLIDLQWHTLPFPMPNDPAIQHEYLRGQISSKRQQELIPYNHCLYKNMYKYEFVIPLDLDELIIPVQQANWSDLMHEITTNYSQNWKENKIYFYPVQFAYFLDQFNEEEKTEFPPYLHTLSAINRANATNGGCKSFMRTDLVKTLHNHVGFLCIDTNCDYFQMPLDLVQLNHYRHDLPSEFTNLKSLDFFKDTIIWKFKDPLIEAVEKTLRNLKKMYDLELFEIKPDKH